MPDKIFGLTLFLDFIDRGHSLRSLYPPPAALPSLPMNAYSKMTEDQKQAIINKAHNVRSEREMHDLVASLVHPTMQ